MVKIAVVGAGVIGLSTALWIQKLEPSAEVTIISEEFSPNTTGDGAAGLWTPFLLGKTPAEKVKKWSKETHDQLLHLWNTEDGGKVGVMLLPAVRITSGENLGDDMWKDAVFGYRVLTKQEMDAHRARLNIPSLKYGTDFVSFICEPTKLLPYYMKQFKDNGGRVIKQRVTDLLSLKELYDIVVNCTGVGACHITRDSDIKPIRGQVLKVIAPDVSYSFMVDDDDGHYVIPNQHTVTLGGTHQTNDWNTKSYAEDTNFIKDGCYNIFPHLKHAKIEKEWVGLRPGRSSVRMELELFHIPGKNPLRVIHNYGHGGSGVTLHWGCGKEAAELVLQAIKSSASKL